MTGQAHWIVVVPLLLGGIGIAWLLWLDSHDNRRFHSHDGHGAPRATSAKG